MIRCFRLAAVAAAAAYLTMTAAAAGSAAPAPAVTTPAAGGAENVWTRHVVQSPSTGKIERFWVGHPKSLKADGKYPSVYFLPGLLDDDDTWKKALDPHLAKYEIVAVCPSVGGATWFMNSFAQPWMRWGDYLTRDLRAFVEANYPVSPEKGQRGVCGISSGAHGAFYHAISQSDLYASVGLVSGSMDLRRYAGAVGLDYWIGPLSPKTAPLYADRSCLLLATGHSGPLPFALFLDCADKDGARPLMEAFRKVLDSKGIVYRWNMGLGGHNWAYWTSRAADHLAWQAAEFERNRRDGRYTEASPAKGAALEPVAKMPSLALSDEALARLRAPWTDLAAAPVLPTTGVAPEGTPLSQTDAAHKEAPVAADLPVRGHAPGLHVFRVTGTVSTPLAKEGAVTFQMSLRNGRRFRMAWTPLVDMPLPGAAADRLANLRVRVAVQVNAPDPLRGGIVIGAQAFGADGKPQGQPVIGQAAPGTLYVEQWVVAPEAKAEFAFSLRGKTALPIATLRAVRVEAEPAAPGSDAAPGNAP